MTVKQQIRTLSLAAVLLLLGACSAAGRATAPSAPLLATPGLPGESVPAASPSPTFVPSSQPSVDAGTLPVDTAAGALAAVVAGHPQFAGYRLVAPPGVASASPASPVRPIGGADRSVLVEQIAGGFRLVFMTGSGDCPSGCIDHRYDVFLVRGDGTVEQACVLERFPMGSGDPCAGG